MSRNRKDMAVGGRNVRGTKQRLGRTGKAGTPIGQRDEADYKLPDEKTRLENVARCASKRDPNQPSRNRRQRIGKRIGKSPKEIQAERLAKGLEWFKGVK